MSVRTLLFMCLAIAWAVCAAAPVHAQTPEQDYTRAQELFDGARYEEALRLFRSTLDATHSPNARLYVGRSLARLGRLPEAYEELRETARDATARAESEARYADTRDAAAAELALLEPRVGKVVVALADEKLVAKVSLEGAELGAARLGVPIAVMPGTVRVTATAPGRQAFDREIAVEGGQTRTITVVLEPNVRPEGPGEDDDGFAVGPVRATGFAIAALGVAGVGAGAVTGALARERHAQLSDECGAVRCTEQGYADVIDEGKTLQTVANVSLGVGGGLALVGAVMIVFGAPEDGASARVDVAPGRAMVRYGSRF